MQYSHDHTWSYFKLEGHRGIIAEHCIHPQAYRVLAVVDLPVKGAAYQGELPGRGDTEILKANHEQRGWETKGKRVLGKWNNSKGSEAEKSVAL